MEKRTPQALLREAAQKIETALVLLDTREKECGECGTRHWANLKQARIYQKFTDTPHKLREAATQLDNNATTVAPIAAPKEQTT